MDPIAIAVPSRAPEVKPAHVLVWLLLAGAAVVFAAADAHLGWLKSLAGWNSSLPNMSLVLLLLALGCEFMDATIGMGYGTTLTPVLILLGLPVKVIVPAAVLSQLAGNLSAAFFHHRVGNVDFFRDRQARNTGLIMGGVGLVVSVATVFVAIRLPADAAKTAVAFIVLLLGVFLLVGKSLRLRFRWRNVAVLAGVAAFNKSFTGGGYGPLVCGGQVLAGLNVRSAVATTALAEAIVCLATATTYYLTGTPVPLAVLLPLVAGSLLSTPLSALVLRRMPTALVGRLMGVAITVLGTLALLKITRGV